MGTAISKSRDYLRKRVRVPPKVRGQAPLAFAVMPPQYYQPMQKPKAVRRRKRMKTKIVYVERRR